MLVVQSWAKSHDLEVKCLHKGSPPPLITAHKNHPLLTRREALFLNQTEEYLLANTHIKDILFTKRPMFYQSDLLHESLLEDTIRFLLAPNKSACLIAQTLPLESSLLRYLEFTHLMNMFLPKVISTQEILSFNEKFISQELQPMREISQRLKIKFPNLHVWHPEDNLKSGIQGGIPCYTDEFHLNQYGSALLRSLF